MDDKTVADFFLFVLLHIIEKELESYSAMRYDFFLVFHQIHFWAMLRIKNHQKASLHQPIAIVTGLCQFYSCYSLMVMNFHKTLRRQYEIIAHQLIFSILCETKNLIETKY